MKRNLDGEMGIESKSDSRSVFGGKSDRRNFGTNARAGRSRSTKVLAGHCRTVFPRCEPESPIQNFGSSRSLSDIHLVVSLVFLNLKSQESMDGFKGLLFADEITTRPPPEFPRTNIEYFSATVSFLVPRAERYREQTSEHRNLRFEMLLRCVPGAS